MCEAVGEQTDQERRWKHEAGARGHLDRQPVLADALQCAGAAPWRPRGSSVFSTVGVKAEDCGAVLARPRGKSALVHDCLGALELRRQDPGRTHQHRRIDSHRDEAAPSVQVLARERAVRGERARRLAGGFCTVAMPCNDGVLHRRIAPACRAAPWMPPDQPARRKRRRRRPPRRSPRDWPMR